MKITKKSDPVGLDTLLNLFRLTFLGRLAGLTGRAFRMQPKRWLASKQNVRPYDRVARKHYRV